MVERDHEGDDGNLNVVETRLVTMYWAWQTACLKGLLVGTSLLCAGS
jgi:hypothetical protein